MQTPSVKQRSSPLNETTSLSVRLLRSETNASAGAPLMNSLLRVQAWRKVRGLRTTDPSAEIEGGMATLHRTGETRPSSLGQTTEAAQESDQHESVLLKEEMKRIQQELMRAKRALENRKAKLRVAREDLLVAKQELNEAQEEIAELTECLEHANKTGDQYRNWWINEVQFTKIILSKVPNANQDWDLLRTSQSHYLGRF